MVSRRVILHGGIVLNDTILLGIHGMGNGVSEAYGSQIGIDVLLGGW